MRDRAWAALGIEPFRVVPCDGHSADWVEGDVGVSALHQAQHPVSGKHGAARLICHDVQHDLGGTRVSAREGVVGGEGEREAGGLPGGAVLVVDDVT